jgi:hypothetical protein
MDLQKIMSVIDIVNNYEDIIKKPIYENWAAKVIQKWWYKCKIVGFIKIFEMTEGFNGSNTDIYAYNKNKDIYKVKIYNHQQYIIDKTKTFNFDYIITDPAIIHYPYGVSATYAQLSIVNPYYNDFDHVEFITSIRAQGLELDEEDTDIIYGWDGYSQEFQDNCRELAYYHNII